MSLTRQWLIGMIVVGILLIGADSWAQAQERERCKVLCAPELLVEPTWTIENLARPHVIDIAGGETRRLPRERVRQ